MATFSVSNFQELSLAIEQSNANGEADTITLTSNIVLEGTLPLINNGGAEDALTIDGGGQFSISGDVGNNDNPDDNVRILFLQDGALNLEGLELEEGVAQGGDSIGGGGAGMGGALFVFDGEVTISDTTFSDNQAIGGDGGNIPDPIQPSDLVGGGIGLDGTDGTDGANGESGGDGEFGGDGGAGGSGITGVQVVDGGDGGDGGFGGGGGPGGNGGSGVEASDGGDGGDGGFGGGGSIGGLPGTALTGDPMSGDGGNGGYGGGAGGAVDGDSSPGAAGFGGGESNGSTGGDGAGFGGAIFIRSGSLTITSSEFEGNSASSGDGEGLGGAIFAVDQTATEYGQLFPNDSGLPDTTPTVEFERVTFEGNSAEDAEGTTDEGVVTPGTSFNNDDLFGEFGGIVAPPPEVSIVTATDAVEGEPTSFTITRSNSIGDLEVVLAVGGTATSEVTPVDPENPAELDFTFGDGVTVDSENGQITVTLLDGQDTLNLTLETTEDTSVEPDETVELTLLSDGYDVSATEGAATATIFNNDFAIAEDIEAETGIGTVPTALTGGTLSFTLTGGNEGEAFAVNSSTGLITVADADAINADVLDSYTLSIDVSNGSETVTESVSILVEDVPEAPNLEDQLFTIPEDTENPSLGTVVASDDDGDAITFAITAGNVTIGDGGGELFAIDPDTGELTITDLTQIDFETTSTYELTVSATDDSEGLLSSEAVITVEVTDVNEAPEIVDQAFEIAENSPAGSAVGTVLAEDEDTGQSLTYTITSGNEDGFFVLDSATGDITVSETAVLNFEDGPTVFNLALEVTDDDAENPQTSSANVTISITDVSEPPVVEDQTFTIAENPTESLVGTVVAEDEDTGETLSFAIIGGDEEGLFEIDETTGEITITDLTQIDFEVQSQYFLTVAVRDSADFPLTDTALITIDVTDVNDIPVIEAQEFTVDENSPANTLVGTVVATDQDSSISNYAITAGNEAGFFTINATTGEITVAEGADLNFESELNTFTLTVEVTDDDVEDPQTSSADFTITLNDVEEAPVIEDQAFTIDENPAEVLVGTVPADDEDTDDTVSFAITAGNEAGVFSIDTLGNILITDPELVDFETQSQYVLTITATDSTDLTDTATVTIDVTDVNELPTITVENVIPELPEDLLVTSAVKVADIVVTDDDLGTNTLSLSGEDADQFEIVGDDLFLKVGATLDFETQPQLDVTIEIDDTEIGTTPDDSVDVAIAVTDVNEAPIIEDQTFDSIPENSEIGQLIGNIVATDEDDDSLEFEIIDGAPPNTFDIDQGGALFVTNPDQLDFETQPEYTLTVLVNDPDGLDDTAIITFSVTDVNEPPVLSDATFSVSENRQGGTVGSLEVTDVDSDAFTFTILSGNELGNFELDATTGEITVADGAEIDFEAGPQTYSLEVEVSDGQLSDTTTVTIDVTDIDESPIIDTSVLEFEVDEDSPSGTVVGTVSASDPENVPLTYSLTSGNEDGFFEIDNDGEITVTEEAALDFEGGPNSFSLDVTVSDGNPETADVTEAITINVLDANEAPVVENQGFFLPTVLGSATITVGTIEATDPDAGQFLTYELGGADADLFTIDNSGVLRAPDPEELTAESFSLTVTVTDSAIGDNLSTTAQITIQQSEDNVPSELAIDISDVEFDVVGDGTNNEIPPVSDDGGSVSGGGGDDTIVGSNGIDIIAGDDGNDQINGKVGDDILVGGEGNDSIFAGQGDDSVSGGMGNDVLEGRGGDDLILGGSGNDIIDGDDGDDTFYGEEGNDRLNGNEGADNLFGGAGDDEIFAGKNKDMLFGGSGDDLLEGRNGSDELNGGTGDDTLLGGPGIDTLAGAESIQRGLGEFDTLTGDKAGEVLRTDTFILGDADGVFYDDDNISSQGLGDFALITDFDIELDLIVLSGSENDYRLENFTVGVNSGTGIFWEGDGSGNGELIGLLAAIEVDSVDLNNSSQFEFT
ncbi:MAG: cadherin domain-containing protein [Cyanobacteria bacterium P01_F01_bin.86]